VRIIDRTVWKKRKGGQEAFAELFTRYEEDIYRMAFVYVQNQEDALDVVQETAYRSFKSIKGLKDEAYLKTWLIRIAIHCSIDLLRKRNKIVPLRMETLVKQEETANGDLPLALTLQDLLDGLDEDEKSVILLRFYQDYTIKETAEALEIPLGTGKTILYRALAKLRRWVKEEDVHEH
jgi:RNA polymerase sigma-70 factor (ECF subfamily)